jgi:hypothetical protein
MDILLGCGINQLLNHNRNKNNESGAENTDEYGQ